MASFRDQFRDLSAFSNLGLNYSTSSNTAMKMFDALLNQSFYHFSDEQLGGWDGTAQKMFEADPDFAMGKILTLGMECFRVKPSKTEKPRQKLFDLSKNKILTHLEKMHLNAAQLLSTEDNVGAMLTFENIIAEYPLDAHALNMAFLLALTTGHTARLRDTPASVVQFYKPGMPFYGNIHGKLCFGQSENGEYGASEISGRLALDDFPLDNWSHHALSHNFEETGRALQGSKFLENTEQDWTRGDLFAHHLWWHKSLFYVQMGEFEAALSLYDDTLGPMTLQNEGKFALSDGSALLMRLQLEGVDIGDRAREQAIKWETHADDFVSLFYDGHISFTSLMAGDKVLNAKLMDNLREYLKGNRKGINKEVTALYGVQLLTGVSEFFDGEYGKAVMTLYPVMASIQEKIQGSTAQKDIFQQILLHSCLKSGSPENLAIAREILDQKLVDRNVKSHTPVNQRVLERILTIHDIHH